MIASPPLQMPQVDDRPSHHGRPRAVLPVLLLVSLLSVPAMGAACAAEEEKRPALEVIFARNHILVGEDVLRHPPRHQHDR